MANHVCSQLILAPDFRLLFEAMPVPCLVLSPDLIIVAVNETYLRATMTVREHILNRGIFDVFPDNPADPAATGVMNLRASLMRVLHNKTADVMPIQKYDIAVHGSTECGFVERHWSPFNTPVFNRAGELAYIIHQVEDVTEKVMAQQVVEESEARFRQIASAMPQIVWTARPDGFVDWYNNWWYDYTGAKRGSNWDDSASPMHPDDVRRTWDRWKQSLATGEAYQIEYRFKRQSDGEYRWHLGRALPIRDESGKIVKWIGTNTDVHDHKLALEQLTEAQRQAEATREELYQFFMQSPEPVARLSGPEHVFALSNPANNELIGCNPLRRKVREVFSDEEAGNFFAMLDQVYQTGFPFVGKEMPFKKREANGTLKTRWVNVGYYPIRDDARNVTGIAAFAHDMTDQVLSRKIIEDNEGKVQRYAEAMPQMAFMTDAQGEVTYFNTRHYEYFGVDRIEDEGSRWKTQNIVHPDDLPISIAAWTESVKTGKTYEVQYRLRRKDGAYRWHLAKGAPDRDGDGNIRAWYGTNTDIHEQKMVEQKLAEEQQLRERFTNALAHDLRTPLSSASIAAEFLLRYPDDESRRGRMLHTIAESLERVNEMISNLLDASRVQAGQALMLTVDECNLYEIVKRAVENLSLVHGNRIVVRAEQEVLGFWSREGLRRVLENLVTNAFKYGAPDTPITVTLERSVDQVKLAVHNYGRALSEVEKSSLFTLFHRANSAKASGKQGWGIGLTVVKGIVESHGGQVTVESMPGTGTIFCVELPLDSRSYSESQEIYAVRKQS